MSQETADELAATCSVTQAQPQATQSQGANDSLQVSQPGANDGATITVDADNNGSNDKPVDNDDEKSNDSAHKTEITLTLKATTEYNSFPFTVESKNKLHNKKKKAV